MNHEFKVGQVLWLKVRYQKNIISDTVHPMLISKIQDDFIEVIALDKVAGRMQNLYYPYNYYIDSDNPKESVIYEDSYAQLNTKLTIQKFEGLKLFRKTEDCLSKTKLEELLMEYKEYQEENIVRKERIIYMSKEEVLKLNKD